MPRSALQFLALSIAAILTRGCSQDPSAVQSSPAAEPQPVMAPAPASAQPAAPALTEEARIEALIQSIADLKDAVFIRNGREHSAAEAADHLRMKWQSQKARIRTAEQFIEHLASRSSISGRPYQIRFADGRTVVAGQWLRERLAE